MAAGCNSPAAIPNKNEIRINKAAVPPEPALPPEQMARKRYVYVPDGKGRHKAVLANVPVTHVNAFSADEPFEKRMLRSYYQLECKEGSRFRLGPGLSSAEQVKEAWSRS